MKLSALVHYLEHLDSITPTEVLQQIHAGMDPVLFSVRTQEIQIPDSATKLEQAYNQTLASVDEFNQQLVRFKNEVKTLARSLEPKYLINSYKLYEEMSLVDSPQYILNRSINFTEDVRQYIISRVQHYSNWKYPGMIIRPGAGEWIEHMVACDPLYLVDHHHELLMPIKEKFNEAYLRRLRWYTISESIDEPMLDNLPTEQFGFCLALNFFHYKPFEVIKAYLNEIYNKLRPGGVLAFSFNDCDRGGAVELAERCFMCYTPGQMVLGLCQSLGFDVRSTYKIDRAATWVELSKPGDITSLRGGQTLAEIRPK